MSCFCCWTVRIRLLAYHERASARAFACLRAFLSTCASMHVHASACSCTSVFIQVVPLDPADTASSAAALLRDAEVVVRWQEEEQPDWTADEFPALEVPPPLLMPPPIDLPLAASSTQSVPPPEAREPPLNLSEMHLPLHGMLQLIDGSTQVVDEQWTFRAVACLLQIREQVAKSLIARESGGAVSLAAATIPVNYVMPNQGMTQCHGLLRELYEPAIRANWERKHGRAFVLRSKGEPTGCNIHGACPAILILCQHHIVCACHA